MKRHPWILAGSALGLLMASAPLGAYPLQGAVTPLSSDARPIVRIQADCAEGAEDCAQGQHRKKRQQRGNDNNQGAQPGQTEGGQRQKQRREPAPAEEKAPAPQARQPSQAEQPKPRKQRQKQAEPAPAQQEQSAPAEKPAPQAEQPRPRDKNTRQKQAEPAGNAAPAQAGEQDKGADQKSRNDKVREYLNKKKNGEQPARQQRKPKPEPQQQGGEPSDAAKPEPKPQQPAQKAEPAPAGQQDNNQATQPKSRNDKLREYLNNKKNGEKPMRRQPQQQENQPGQQAEPNGAAPQPGQPAQGKAAGEKPAGNQANGRPAKPELPADTKPQALPKGEANAQPLPDNAAPVTDSGKRAGNRHDRGNKNGGGERPRNQPPEGKPMPLPQSDSAAQDRIRDIGRIESVEAMQGRRIDRDRWREEWRKRREDRRDRDEGTVVNEINNRVIIKYGDNIYVDNRGFNPRLERHARDSYVEELPNGFTRYTIVKDDGARVVTIRNADGDIVRRSRITPDDREIVLYYVPEDDYGRIRRGYVDAGADLPPLVLDIPANQYILEAQSAEPDDYYTYLDAPPVEPVERIYSVDEVVHSARIRDKVRRIDLDTITFDTGSADIGQDQVNKLEALGDAINRILKDNPAETFLIEGHTDAVGSNESNLVLSDERAQSVAEALTSVFGIPAENLTTQGYGEEYLKIDTESANRENRRVAVRRITPLVAPVASAQ